MPNFGPVHTLVVHTVGEQDALDFEDYEIIHPVECKIAYDEVWRAERYECGVAWQIDNTGARFSLGYSHTPVTMPGSYPIQAWSETFRYFEGTEYDGGIAIVSAAEPNSRELPAASDI